MRPIPVPSVRLVEPNGLMSKHWYDFFRDLSVGDDAATFVESIVEGANVTVDATDPANPIVSSTAGAPVQDDWTPSIRFNGLSVGVTYDIQTGRSVKIGNLLHLWAYVVLTAKGSSTGALSLIVPEAARAGTILYGGVVSNYANVTGVDDVGCILAGGTDELFLTTAGGALFWTDADMANDSEFTLHIAYEVEP